MSEIIRKGICKVHYAPQGDHGLEGYQLNNNYNFHYKLDKEGYFFKIFLEGETGENNCVTSGIFKKYFKEL
ncbi:MAG: hypothetical protein PHP92_05710 [Candidatus Nanoarchaeia archaeon]|nr:hypothetical protein [Candidatus Nanoarchaeia archaeon]